MTDIGCDNGLAVALDRIAVKIWNVTRRSASCIETERGRTIVCFLLCLCVVAAVARPLSIFVGVVVGRRCWAGVVLFLFASGTLSWRSPEPFPCHRSQIGHILESVSFVGRSSSHTPWRLSIQLVAALLSGTGHYSAWLAGSLDSTCQSPMMTIRCQGQGECVVLQDLNHFKQRTIPGCGRYIKRHEVRLCGIATYPETSSCHDALV